MSKAPLVKETWQQAKAFELYYMLPEGERSHTKVAEELGFKPTTIDKWSVDKHWALRIEHRDMKAALEMQRLSETSLVTQRNAILKQLTKALEKTDIEKIAATDAYTFNVLVKMLYFLHGEATEIKTLRIEVVNVFVAKIVAVIAEHVEPGKLATVSQEIRSIAETIGDEDESNE